MISTRFPFRILQCCIHYSRYLTIRLSLFLKLSIWSPSRLPFHTISSSPLLLFVLDYATPLLVDVLSRMFDRKGKWRFMNGRSNDLLVCVWVPIWIVCLGFGHDEFVWWLLGDVIVHRWSGKGKERVIHMRGLALDVVSDMSILVYSLLREMKWICVAHLHGCYLSILLVVTLLACCWLVTGQ